MGHDGLGPPSINDSGYSSIVLDRLATHVCRIAGVDTACIFVRDEQDPRVAIAVAAHGLPIDVIGLRLGADQVIVDQVVSGCAPGLIPETAAAGIVVDPSQPLVATLGAPIRSHGTVRGTIWASTRSPDRSFGPADAELLCELADFTTFALDQPSHGAHIEPTVNVLVEALEAAMELRDVRTAEHSRDVVGLVSRVARRLGVDAAARIELEYAARLHDVGKIRVPDALLHKPGPLDEAEWALMKRHPVWGAETLAAIPGLQVVATIVRFHHERWDGTGYPDGLEAERIPLGSRIIGTCDAYSAMTSDRPYRCALSVEEAIDEIKGESGSQFDPVVVNALIDSVELPNDSPVGAP